MTPDETLISHALSSYRARDAEGHILPDPAWMDLDGDGREAAFDAALALRKAEAAIDPQHLSSTARAVLARITQRTP